MLHIRPPCLALALAALLATSTELRAEQLQFAELELPTRLTVGYAVRLIDMNADARLDIVIVDSKRIIWLENPNWKEHTLLEDGTQKNDNVTFAPTDIDGDGRVDFAIGADWQFGNTESGGTIGWISGGAQPTKPWKYHAIGQEPTTHRMRFADIDGDERDELIVQPLKGRGTSGPEFAESGVRLLSYEIPENPASDTWQSKVINDELHVSHNFWPTDFNGDGKLDILTASFEGVSLLERSDDGTWSRTHLGAGYQNPDQPGKRGASEIKDGRLADGSRYIATIEPWHGFQVVVYTPPEQDGELWQRHVLDDDLQWGHAVWCANLDSDDDLELIVGVRDDKNEEFRRGLRIYDPQGATPTGWRRHLIDPGSVAIEDLAAGDLNADGRVDIVAVGRQTHNVKIYWNETK
jgi:hypothetical protein